MNATTIIATFGDKDHWDAIAAKAIDSVASQTVPVALVRTHEETLATARNKGAELAGTEWLCFLDADDQLDSRYVENMLMATGDIRRPATLGIYEDGSQDETAIMIPRKDLKHANFIVIGAFVRKEQFLRVGGFRELPALEDWDLWIRCWQEGAIIEDVPEAVYHVNVHSGSRNSQTAIHNRVYGEIRKRYFS